MPRSVRLLPVLAWTLTLTHAVGQSILYRIEGDDPSTQLGNSVAAIGDVNADGMPDFAVSGYQEDTGIVRVFSGADGSELHTITSAYPNTIYGEDRNLTALGDLDGDGISDIAVGTPWGNELEPLGFFDVHSGTDGAYLTTHRGDLFESLTNEIAGLGDVDGDGVSDYAASTFEKGNEGGYVAIYSGKEQVEIARLLTNEPVWFWSIAGPGDLNGDALADIAIGLWSEEGNWGAGQVRVISGALFTDPLFVSPNVNINSEKTLEFTVWTVDGRIDESTHLGEGIAQGLNALGDIDGDGVPDLGVGTGAVDDGIILSGTSGSRLHEWTSDRLRLNQFVVETEAIGDANGDGVPDIVVGRRGSLTLHSVKDGMILDKMTGEGGFGEEIAAIGDLDGDGLSEILTSAPEGGYALVLSFAPKENTSPSPISITLDDGEPVTTWCPDLTEGTLERSPDLLHWSSVIEIDTIDEARYPISDRSDGPTQYYRVRVAAE